MAGLGPSGAGASSHREAPLISGDPRSDNTDVYAFVSPDDPDTVTLIANWIPFEEPNGGPNFYPFADDARYHIKIDNDGDGRAGRHLPWTSPTTTDKPNNQFLYNTGAVTSFHDPDLLFRQTYDLYRTNTAGHRTRLLHDAIVAPSRVGKASMPHYGRLRNQAITRLPGGGQTFAGQADDPFFLDLRVFDLLYGGDLSEARQRHAGRLQRQHRRPPGAQDGPGADAGTAKHNPVVGIWSTTDRRGAHRGQAARAATTTAGVQVSRLGNPLVNEVVVPYGYKDAFNSIEPYQDHTVQPVVDKVLDPILPRTIEKVYGIPAPPTPRNDLFEIFLNGICKACGPDQRGPQLPAAERRRGRRRLRAVRGAAAQHDGAARRAPQAPRRARRRPGRASPTAAG